MLEPARITCAVDKCKRSVEGPDLRCKCGSAAGKLGRVAVQKKHVQVRVISLAAYMTRYTR